VSSSILIFIRPIQWNAAKVLKTIQNIFPNPFGKAKTLRIFAPRFWKIKQVLFTSITKQK